MAALSRQSASASLAVLLAICSNASWSASERYDYDLAGRLTRRLDDQNRSTDYVYDAAGNILQVGAPTPAQPPTISSGPLGDFYRNDIRQVSVSGANLAGTTIRTSSGELTVSNVIQSPTAISFRLGVSVNAPLGAHQIFISNSLGTAQVGLNVVASPAFVFEPSPISVAPDSVARKFTLRLSSPFPEARTFSLSTLSPATARTKTNQVSLTAGQTEAELGIIGVATGSTLLRLGGAALFEPIETLISVSPGAATPSFYTPPVGISKGTPWSTSPANQALSGGIGISKGVPWSTSPVNQAASGAIGISKGTPWSSSTGNRAVSGSIGIAKGVPWSSAQINGPVVAPLVGINKP